MTKSELDSTRTENLPSAPRTVVVVGASHAAVQFAESLRSAGFDGTVRLIGEEPHHPYYRPSLSKAYLKGEVAAESLGLRGPHWYADNSIDLTLGERVLRIEQAGNGTGRVHTTKVGSDTYEASTYPYDRLVLATGARPRKLHIAGADAEGVIELRSVDDALGLRQRVNLGPVVVIGGGFIGLEAAATIRGLGGTVTVLEAGPRLMGRAIGDATASFLLAAHQGMGVDVRLSTAPEAILTDDGGSVTGVQVAQDTFIPAATVLVGIGVEPNISLAEQLGLSCAGGIVVDHRGVSSQRNVLAIGDCTIQPHPGPAPDKSRPVRLESVDNAAEQAASAARVIVGQPDSVRNIPWFWSDQGDWKLQIAGLTGSDDTVVIRSEPNRPRRLVVGFFANGRLSATECVNSPADFLALRGALNNGTLVTAEAFADTSVPLKQLLRSPAPKAHTPA
ncbi:hypothetical protein CH272_18645 [Rhodococcus sp. 05-340-1]|uniref:NAD(P)/FAD-dependent oxidoreductase n=1 Tax=Nocardiaceae TaxID=85025 RepID=UPI00050CCA45|nr:MULTISPECIES: FAD-dependent oxidoreductase [Rhodococcus]OZC87709.1 hypothetical protein CH254_14155 [Rhodococcus sp. 06-412-2C]OZC96360.1 hypothetical protein CH279_14325 [Rhodococcus sp. 06-412-2B]OZD65344.1 hypothetical protein CH271_20145 [Rhodococcus sp. 05-340-2]OZD74610.1 hypothetical protein CH272_18645 [Rhodococcus sp. 05-340-1]OZD86617.1 hypothetical protein CH273_00380 [Rhodococcus sp. 05-339-2]